MSHHLFTGLNGVPGISPVIETFENEFLWGNRENFVYTGLVIGADARDVGNTNAPDILRAGLLLGQVTATRQLKEWTPGATDGSEYIWGVLNQTVSLRSISGNQVVNGNAPRLNGFVVCSGGLLAHRLIIPGEVELGLLGKVNEQLARVHLRENFKLNDTYQRVYSVPTQVSLNAQAVADNGNNQFVATVMDSGKQYNATQSVQITLPAVPSAGLCYTFYAAATINIVAGASNIRQPGEALVATLPVNGAIVKLVGTGTEWLVS